MSTVEDFAVSHLDGSTGDASWQSLGSVTAKPESLSSLPELFPIITTVSFSLFTFLLNIY
jgi:hypothetical protein